MLYKFGIFLCRLYLLLRVRYKVEGRENIPKEGGFILAANHRHNVDALLLGVTLGMDIHYMAKIELFRGAVGRWLFKHLHCIAVDRGKGDTDALAASEAVLQEGGVLGMFPEGHRSPDGRLLRPKSGTAMLAMKTHAPVLPAAICFHEPKLKWRTSIVVRYGKLIPYSELGFTADTVSTKEIKHASSRIMGSIADLLGEYQKKAVDA